MVVKAKANCNFQALSGSDIHDVQSDRYKEYRAEWVRRPADFDHCDFPVHLDIESTNRCNLKCTFCDKLPFLSKEQIGDMDFALYTRIIDEGVENGLYSIKLSYRGEPLIHKRIVDMVRYAKEAGVVDVYFNTNGMLLNEARSKALIEAGLDRISVSVEGTDAEEFENARVGAKFDSIKRNVSRLMALREKMGSETPKVRLQTVAFPDLNLSDYAVYWKDYCDETAAIDFKDAEGDFGTSIVPDWACPQLWQRMTIEWDGTVHPCNNDDQGNLVVGNAAEDSLVACWSSLQAESARDKHKSGDSHKVEACAMCPWRDAQINK